MLTGFYGRPWTTEQRKDLFQKYVVVQPSSIVLFGIFNELFHFGVGRMGHQYLFLFLLVPNPLLTL